jgi:hypothetical protein
MALAHVLTSNSATCHMVEIGEGGREHKSRSKQHLYFLVISGVKIHPIIGKQREYTI